MPAKKPTITENRTVLCHIIQTHYKIQDMESGPWTLERFKDLSRLLHLTPRELSMLVRVNPKTMLRQLTTGRVPGGLKLLLDIVDRTAHQNLLGKVYEKPLFPEL